MQHLEAAMEPWTRAEAEAYRSRWRALEVRESALRRRGSPGERLAALCRLYDAARLCGGDPGRERGVERVRRRWARLRRALLG